ncbi:MAG: hypothetical protein HDQ96_15850 [Lachnospiraceae bacterium]|nr:hypothetical protein [Lachnospiraceae bacterium]
MDSDLEERAERLYEQMGTTFAEAIRIFAEQSVREKAIPFTMHLAVLGEKRILGQLMENIIGYLKSEK